jgi:hypothetical protein
VSTLGDLLGSSVRVIGCFVRPCIGECKGDALKVGRVLCFVMGDKLGPIVVPTLDASEGSDEGNSEASKLGDLLGSPVKVVGALVGSGP